MRSLDQDECPDRRAGAVRRRLAGKPVAATTSGGRATRSVGGARRQRDFRRDRPGGYPGRAPGTDWVSQTNTSDLTICSGAQPIAFATASAVGGVGTELLEPCFGTCRTQETSGNALDGLGPGHRSIVGSANCAETRQAP